MCTLTTAEALGEQARALTPIATIILAVHERAKARGLGFIREDAAVTVAREHYHTHGSLALAITAGQRTCDRLARVEP